MVRRRAIALSSVLFAFALIYACGGSQPARTTTTTAEPSAVANCWIASRGEYRLIAESGEGSATVVEDAARLIDARLAAMDLPQHEVSVTTDGAIVVLLPPLEVDVATDVRTVIGSAGRLLFVPLAEDSDLDVGDELPQGLTPLFGREGLQDVRPARDDADRPAIDVTLNPVAARALADYTAANVGGRMAIAVDETIISVPVIQAPIHGGELQISGPESMDRVLVALLLLPVMPGTLEQVSFGDAERPAGCPV